MDYIEMGNRLRLLRESKTDEMGRRFSQGKLVDEFADNGIKMTQSKLSSLENGDASLTPDLIILYSEYFDVSTDFILKGDNVTFSSSNELISHDSKYDTTELMEALQYWECKAENLQSHFVMQSWTTPIDFLSSAIKYYTANGKWQQYLILFILAAITVSLFQTDKGRSMMIGAGGVLWIIFVVSVFILYRECDLMEYRRCMRKISDIKKELNIL